MPQTNQFDITQGQMRAYIASSRPPQPRPDFPPRLRITSQIDGRTRGSRTFWRTPTELNADELTDQELREIKADPELTVEEIGA